MAELLSPEELKKMQREIAKEYGGDLFWGSDENLKLRKLPLGIATVDSILDGGLAFDRMTLLFGQESAGKTLIAMFAIKAAIEKGLSVVFIDVEKTWTDDWARTLGIDPDKVAVSRPRTGEEVFDQAKAFVRAGVGLIVIDSLAAIQAASKLEADAEKSLPGINARLINDGLKTINQYNKGTLVIVINQLREDIGGYGNPEVLPGGLGQRYVAWQRIRVKRAGWIEEGSGANKKRVGFNLQLVIEKNKQGSPWKLATVPFYFTGQLDEIAGLIDFAVEMKVIRHDSPHYYVPTPDGEEIKMFGRPKMIEYIKENEAIQQYLTDRVNAISEVDL